VLQDLKIVRLILKIILHDLNSFHIPILLIHVDHDFFSIDEVNDIFEASSMNMNLIAFTF